MNSIIVIKNREDAKKWLMNKATPKEIHGRIGQAVALGLVGSGLGAGANYAYNREAKTGALIGGALGALGGFAIKPKMTEEENSNIAKSVLLGAGNFYVVGSLPSGEVYHKIHKNILDAKADAVRLKAEGVKAYIVNPNDFNEVSSSRQFGLLDKIPFGGFSSSEDYKRGILSHKNLNPNLNKIDKKLIPMRLKKAISEDSIASGENSVIKNKKFLGGVLGAVGGLAVGSGIGGYAGKKIAMLKSEEDFIREFITKFPKASIADARAAYLQRIVDFRNAGRNIGGFSVGVLGSTIGESIGKKRGVKDAKKLTDDLLTGKLIIEQ